MTDEEVNEKVVLMMDIESLDLGPRSVILQIGCIGVDASDFSTVLLRESLFMPMQPQLDLGRTVSANTLCWWMTQDDTARNLVQECVSDDYVELAALLRNITRKFKQVTRDADYEIWARGPQFDIVNIESLMRECGVEIPWRYDKVHDLRTLMREADLHTADVPRPEDMTPHVAYHDCRYQLLCLEQARRVLTRGK